MLVSCVGVWNVFTIWLWMYIYHLRHIRWEQDKIDFDLVFHPRPVEDDTAIKCHQDADYGRRVQFADGIKDELKEAVPYLNSSKAPSAQVAPQLRAQTPIAPS